MAVTCFKFGEFELDRGRFELRREGRAVKLERIPMDLLILLLEKDGSVATRQDIVERLWGKDVFLDTEHGINTAIRKIRSVLREDAEHPGFIQTVPGRGYRFVADSTIRKTPTATRLDKTITPEPAGAFSIRPGLLEASSPEVVPAEVVPAKGVPPKRGVWWPAAIAVFALCSVGGAALAFHVSGLRDLLFVKNRNNVGPVHSIAVLPLVNLSGDVSQEYFADGMTESLITELGRVSSSQVISRQSVMQYAGSKKSLQEIAGELKVDAVLEGAVQRSGDQVLVTVHLSQAVPERQLWAQEYNRSFRDVLSLQGEIARAVADEIHATLKAEERTRLTIPRTVDPEAHDDYLRGRYLLGLIVASHSRFTDRERYGEHQALEAIGQFQQAIIRDPGFAPAYAGLADAYIVLGDPALGGHPPREALSHAKAEAQKALELDPSLAEVHFSLAQTLEYDWNWPEAEKEYRLAVKLNPNDAEARAQYGRFLQALGRNDEAITQLNYATHLDPFGIKTKVFEAYVTYASRQYDRAIKQFESLGDDWGLVWSYRDKKMYPQAIAAWRRWEQTHPSQRMEPVRVATIAGIYGLEGKKPEAEKLIGELREASRHRYVSGFFFAEAYADLGEKDRALTWLERAYDEHDQWMVFVNSYPGLDRLRSEPRFRALMHRMNFPD